MAFWLNRKRRVFFAAGAALILTAVMVLLGMSMWSEHPSNLGVANGRLAPCPSSPNCVCTYAEDAGHAIEPMRFTCSADRAWEAIREIVQESQGAIIISSSDRYLHAEFRSRVFRFVDDVEFFVDAENRLIHFRSASRVGYGDFGANRKRMEKLRGEFERVVEISNASELPKK